MPKITKVLHNKGPNNDRSWIYIDGEYCTSVRSRTFSGMSLAVGDAIHCEELIEREKHFWKHTYNQKSWEAEKVRLSKVEEFISSIDSRIRVERVGFGADSTEFIEEHPEISGEPDLKVTNTETGNVLCLIEVTGTEIMRGNTYWVRPDKIEYSIHSHNPVWIAVHYKNPEELMRFIRPDNRKKYRPVYKNIGGAEEIYVEFTDSDNEVQEPQVFAEWLKGKL